MKKRLFATMLLFTCILSLTSCSKDDGDWDAMKWEKNNYEEASTKFWQGYWRAKVWRYIYFQMQELQEFLD